MMIAGGKSRLAKPREETKFLENGVLGNLPNRRPSGRWSTSGLSPEFPPEFPPEFLARLSQEEKITTARLANISGARRRNG